ncbi:hypothetical protein ACSQ67_019392 [Phaseolus vulgaris]
MQSLLDVPLVISIFLMMTPLTTLTFIAALLVTSMHLGATFLMAVLLKVSMYLEAGPLTALTLLARPIVLHHVKPLAAALVKQIGFSLGWEA